MLAGDLGLQLIERNIEILRDVKSRDEFALVAKPHRCGLFSMRSSNFSSFLASLASRSSFLSLSLSAFAVCACSARSSDLVLPVGVRVWPAVAPGLRPGPLPWAYVVIPLKYRTTLNAKTNAMDFFML